MNMRAAVFLLCFALGACGQLRVKVDVLDREYVRAAATEEADRAEARRIIALRPGEIATLTLAKFFHYRTAVLEAAGNFEAMSRSLPSDSPKELASGLASQAESLKQSMTAGGAESRATKVGTELEAIGQQLRERAALMGWRGTGPLPGELRGMLGSFAAADKRLWTNLEIERLTVVDDVRRMSAAVGVKLQSSSVTPATTAAEAGATAASRTATQIAASPTLGDPAFASTDYAHIVASAPELSWSPNYNQAFGSGTMGSVDIVIKMNSTADFTVKGMRFDARTVAAVASKVATQSLLLGAQMAGAPVKTSGNQSTGDGSALAKSSDELGAVDATLEARRAAAEANQLAVRTLAKAILGARATIESATFAGQAPADRKAVDEAIKITLDAVKPTLQMQGLQ